MPDLRTEQPMPTPNESPSVQSMVIADMQARIEVGIQRYGTPLQPHNGRDALRDAYEEALDLATYLRQAIAERDGEAVLSRRELKRAAVRAMDPPGENETYAKLNNPDGAPRTCAWSSVGRVMESGFSVAAVAWRRGYIAAQNDHDEWARVGARAAAPTIVDKDTPAEASAWRRGYAAAKALTQARRDAR